MTDASEPREPDLVDRFLGMVDHALDLVHDKVLRPIILVARVLAFGLIIALAAVILVVVVVIGFVRLLTIYAFHGRDWLSYASVGALSVFTGMVLWRRRRPLKLRK